MMLPNVSRLLVLTGLILAPSSAALEESDENHLSLRARLSETEREMFWNANRCEDNLARCWSEVGTATVPFESWITTLDNLDGGRDGVFSDLAILVKALQAADYTDIAVSFEQGFNAVSSTIDQVQTIIQNLQKTEELAKEPEVEVSENQLEDAAQTAIDFITAALNFVEQQIGLDLGEIRSFVEVTLTILTAVPLGIMPTILTAVGSVSSFLLPLLVNVLGDVIIGNNRFAAREPGCPSYLQECQFTQMTQTVIPSLVGAAIVSQGYLVEGPAEAEP